MLIGCGCLCDPDAASNIRSGSFRSDSIDASDRRSLGSIDGAPTTCGSCYNFPAEWQVTLNSNWWTYPSPGQYFDCRAGLSGTFTLRPYGPATISPGAKLYLDPIAENYCTVWKSDELAQQVSRTTIQGTPNTACSNNTQNYARIELVSFDSSFGANGECRPTYFVMFVWWVVSKFLSNELQEGWTWEWTVPIIYEDRGDGLQCYKRNCVRCFGADIGAPRGVFLAYGLDPAFQNQWNTIPVCPG